jgi:integrase
MRGSIFKRRLKGGSLTYGLVYDDMPGPNGKRNQKRIRGFRTRHDAERKLTQIRAAMQNGGYYEPSKMLVSEYIDKWLAEMEHSVRPRTAVGYRERLRDYVAPRIGHMPMWSVQPQHLKDIYDELLRDGRKRKREQSKGLHPRSVVHVHRIAHAMFAEAVRSKIILSNPCASIRPPRVPHTEQRVLDETEARHLIQSAEETDLHAFVVLAISTGARAGELLSLTWPYVDLDAGRINIAYGQARDGSRTETKTKRSRRTIALPPSALSALRVHRAKRKLALGELWSDQGFLFTNDLGQPWRVVRLSYEFRKLATRADMRRDVHTHTLRHTYASLALKAGVPVTTVSANLGHSSTATTMNIYAHHIPSAEDAAAKALEQALVGAS